MDRPSVRVPSGWLRRMTLSFRSGVVLVLCAVVAVSATAEPENAAQRLTRSVAPPSRDLGDEANRALYAVGYAHLDTQWRWDFVTTIDEYIRATMDDNFALFEKHPEYVFNFTGSVRYEMMKEYYPERYERLKGYITDGRWRVSGSSVDEGDVNVPSAESIVRQVLYGNRYFAREFGETSHDFMLPDCFGFPASMPSIWAHCGLLGFSTQKLTWGSAVGIPFKIGVWEGPNGDGVIAALDPGPYVGAVEGRVDTNPTWVERVNRNGRMYGVWADYHYYGTGDQGGAPRETDVSNYVDSASADDGAMKLVLGSSDQMYVDITSELREGLPRYRGDMLLTEHSAGTLTSQSYMKRWNRMAEQLADAAERASVIGSWMGGMTYPYEKLERAWVRVLANQMHDILPGTSIPRAYRYSWNDEIVGMNLFADVLTQGVGVASSGLDTDVEGTPLVVFNPLSIEREEVVEAVVPVDDAGNVRVFGPDGVETPSQLLANDGTEVTVLFLAKTPANGFAVYDVRPSKTPFEDDAGPTVTPEVLENESFVVRINSAGDIASVYSKELQRELLSEPATLVFTHEKPRNWPAWNMDWADRQQPPIGKVDGAASVRIVENGPVRVSLEIARWSRNSLVKQQIRLARGDAGHTVDVVYDIDWQSAEVALKAAYPLAASNPNATYNWGVGTIERGNNDPAKYEVPSHEWIDLTDESGEFGVSILEDSKFGSDKLQDNELRLTLLYTPGVRGSYIDQHSQDWGKHDIRTGLYAHAGDWRESGSEWRGRRLNQPLRVFVAPKHEGALGRSMSFAAVDSPQVDIRAIKRAEERDSVIVRVQELWGRHAESVALQFPTTSIVAVREVDGQERMLSAWQPFHGEFRFDLKSYGLRAFEVRLRGPNDSSALRQASSTPLELPFNADVASTDSDPSDGAMDLMGRTYPAEMLPDQLIDRDVAFQLGAGEAGAAQAVAARGQTIDLSNVRGDRIHLLVAATEDVTAPFRVGDEAHLLEIQNWTGFVGQWDDRVWDRTFEKVDYKTDGRVVAITPGFIKRSPIAWFATHRHDSDDGNQAYRFSYLYHVSLPRPDGADVLTLPFDERVRVFAASVSDSGSAPVTPAAPLYDDFVGRTAPTLRHDYDRKETRIFTDREAIASAEIERAVRFEELTMGAPSRDDDIDTNVSSAYSFEVIADERMQLHRASGAVGGVAVRLNDGLVAQNHDDTNRCVWWDNEGRFVLEFDEPKEIGSIRTYSWHRTNRAPQLFSVWGDRGEVAAPTDFGIGEMTSWELIAVVDSRELGDGGVHASRVAANDGAAIGPYRRLLWITEDVGEGTFFTEIDLDFAEGEQ